MNENPYQELSEKGKKDFLSNDLAERIIRVEQRVSLRFGKMIPYDKTEYYKSLNPVQKKNFEKYLKNKKKKRTFFSAVFILPIVFLFFLRTRFTGNVINETLGEYSSLNYLLFFIIFIMLAVGMLSLRNKKRIALRINSHIKIIDDILVRKQIKKEA